MAYMTNQDPTPEISTPIDVIYRTPGVGFKRKSFKTEAAFDRWLAGLDDDIEVQVGE